MDTQPYHCPRCHSDLTDEHVADSDLQGCPNCGGLWLDIPSAKRVLDTLSDVTLEAATRTSLLATENVDTEKAHIPCPVCSEAMDVFMIPQSTVTLDKCDTHGIWFDRWELQAVAREVESARERPAEQSGGSPTDLPQARSGDPNPDENAEWEKTKARGSDGTSRATAIAVGAGVAAGAAVGTLGVAAIIEQQEREKAREALEGGAEVAEVGVDVAELEVDVAAESGFGDSLVSGISDVGSAIADVASEVGSGIADVGSSIAEVSGPVLEGVLAVLGGLLEGLGS